MRALPRDRAVPHVWRNRAYRPGEHLARPAAQQDLRCLLPLGPVPALLWQWLVPDLAL